MLLFYQNTSYTWSHTVNKAKLYIFKIKRSGLNLRFLFTFSLQEKLITMKIVTQYFYNPTKTTVTKNDTNKNTGKEVIAHKNH